MRRFYTFGVVALVIFVFGLGLGIWGATALGWFNNARVVVVEGEIRAVSNDGTDIVVSPQPNSSGEAYTIRNVYWRERGLPWTNTQPICLEPLTSGQRVRMGVANVPESG